jgi:hypothetical protein
MQFPQGMEELENVRIGLKDCSEEGAMSSCIEALNVFFAFDSDP